jgi:predicted transcriptional regulator
MHLERRRTMRGRKPEKFELKPRDKAILQKLVRDGQTPMRVARRAQILVRRADQQQRVCTLSEKVERNAATIWRVCQRYAQGGLQAALYDATRSGRPLVFFQGSTQAD